MQLSLEFRDVCSRGRSDILLLPCVVSHIWFLTLGFVYNDLCFFLLGAECLLVPFVATTLGLLSEAELGISAMLSRSRSSVTVPVFS